MRHRSLVSATSFALATLIGFTTFATAQNFDASQTSDLTVLDERHEYLDTDGEVLVTGVFKELKGSTVTIREANNSYSTFRLNQFSKDDQKMIKNAAVAKKKYENGQKESVSVLRNMNTKDVPILIKGCNRLKKIGRYASNKRTVGMLKKLWKEDDPRLKRAAFVAYCHVAPPTKDNLRHCIVELTENNVGMRKAFAKHSYDMLKGISQFGDDGFEYLQQIAYTGSLKVKDYQTDPNVDPVNFEVPSEGQLLLRANACKVMGSFKSLDTVESLLHLLKTIEDPAGGRVDAKSLKEVLTSLGKIGIKDDDVVAALKRHAKELPEVTKEAMEKLKDSK